MCRRVGTYVYVCVWTETWFRIVWTSSHVCRCVDMVASMHRSIEVFRHAGMQECMRRYWHEGIAVRRRALRWYIDEIGYVDVNVCALGRVEEPANLPAPSPDLLRSVADIDA